MSGPNNKKTNPNPANVVQRQRVVTPAANARTPVVPAASRPTPAAPAVYRPQPLQKVLQRKTAQPQRPGPIVDRLPRSKAAPPARVPHGSARATIQRAEEQLPKAVLYGNLLKTYSVEELQRAAQQRGLDTGYTGHLSKNSNYNASGVTEDAQSSLAEQCRQNREDDKAERKQEIAERLAEKRVGKRPGKAKLQRVAKEIADQCEGDPGTGLERFEKYLQRQGFSAEEIEDLMDLYPM